MKCYTLFHTSGIHTSCNFMITSDYFTFIFKLSLGSLFLRLISGEAGVVDELLSKVLCSTPARFEHLGRVRLQDKTLQPRFTLTAFSHLDSSPPAAAHFCLYLTATTTFTKGGSWKKSLPSDVPQHFSQRICWFCSSNVTTPQGLETRRQQHFQGVARGGTVFYFWPSWSSTSKQTAASRITWNISYDEVR